MVAARQQILHAWWEHHAQDTNPDHRYAGGALGKCRSEVKTYEPRSYLEGDFFLTSWPRTFGAGS
jgi:hypothetical protein